MVSLAPFPPASIRAAITVEQWQDANQLWHSVLKQHLSTVSAGAYTAEPSLIAFLCSFYEALSADSQTLKETYRTIGSVCKDLVFALVRQTHPPPKLLTARFLSDLLRVEPAIANDQTFVAAYQTQVRDVDDLQSTRKRMVQALSISRPGEEPRAEAWHLLPQILRLCAMSIDIAKFFAASEEFLVGLCRAFPSAKGEEQKREVEAVFYLTLTSLLKETKHAKPSAGVLLDQMYSIEQWYEEQTNEDNLLTAMIRETPLLPFLRMKSGMFGSARLAAVLEPLEKLERQLQQSIGRPHSDGSFSNHHDETMHIHIASSVSQVQELFPELSTSVILRLLDEYSDNIETLAAHYLEGSIPPHLLDPSAATASQPPSSSRLEPLPQRRNVYDNDAVPDLALATSGLHIGKRDKIDAPDADDPSDTVKRKAAIWAALSKMDGDDDEEDDTYDNADVGEAVDGMAASGPVEDSARDRHRQRRVDKEDGEDIDEVLFGAWMIDKSVFGRDSKTRISPYRMEIRQRLGVTNEVIEGWGVMMERGGRKREEELENRFAGSKGGVADQRALKSSRWVAQVGEEEDEEGTDEAGSAARGGGRGRRRGRGGGRGGAPASARGRARKEANKGAVGNHHRRDQRAKKMARGGFGVPNPP